MRNFVIFELIATLNFSKLNRFFTIVALFLFNQNTFSQDSVRPIYSVTIYKTENNEGVRRNIYIKIDSLGSVYADSKSTKISFDKEKFSKEIATFVKKENVDKHPGNNNISFIEPPTPKLNGQNIIVFIMFLDDVAREQDLRNKTYYSWGEAYDKGNNSYPLFQYLSIKEVMALKSLLE